LKRGAGAVIIKKGEKGSYFLNRGGLEIKVPAYRAKVVDTTGAGDCFCAGFIKGLSLGWDLKKSLRLGNAAGACAVEALGATTGIHSLKQVSEKTI
jgi:sugar/nucleoside kinase (ribokinase family)